MTGVGMMNLSELLATYRDGDEHGWDVEFEFLQREHAARIDVLTVAIQNKGMLTPILLGSDGRVWNGHHRLCVAKIIGLEEVPVERCS